MSVQNQPTAPTSSTIAAVLPPATGKGQVVAPASAPTAKTTAKAAAKSGAKSAAKPRRAEVKAAPAKKAKSAAPKKAAAPTKTPNKVAAKSQAKSAAKPAKAGVQTTKPARAAAPVAAKPVAKAAAAKPVKAKELRKKSKVVRDSFTMPEADYAKLAALKARCLKAGISVKKSELLRAGLQLLETLPAKKLQLTLATLENIKTGRPTND